MANVNFTVPNKNGSYDGDTVVKQYDSVTINAGDTVTVDQPCRGLIIFCKGDMVINGTLSMTARGAAANPTISGGSDNNAVQSAGIIFGFYQNESTDSLTVTSSLYNGMGNTARTVIANMPSGSGTNYKRHTIPRTANNGASRPSVSSSSDRENAYDIQGGNASSGGAFFGGGGAGGQAYEVSDGQGGAGGHSTCFSGGSGGGGAAGGGAAPSSHRGSNADNYGGVGGTGGTHDENLSRPAGPGGAGNPGGPKGGGNGGESGDNGTGGFLMLIVGGNLTLGSSGKIQANGARGGDNTSGLGDNSSGGGASGGGHIAILCRGTVTTNGGSNTISAGYYVGNAGTALDSKDTQGFQNFPIQAWGGQGGINGNTPSPSYTTFDMYTENFLTRNGGTGGKGLIAVYDLV